jgi:hypothetical protein
MVDASCHCGAVRIELPRKPRLATECNCSICRRYGALWSYYRASDVHIHASPERLASYLWGPRSTRFMRCEHCGCVTHWEEARPSNIPRIGVNVRNLDPGMLAGTRIRHLDGASTWKYLD